MGVRLPLEMHPQVSVSLTPVTIMMDVTISTGLARARAINGSRTICIMLAQDIGTATIGQMDTSQRCPHSAGRSIGVGAIPPSRSISRSPRPNSTHGRRPASPRCRAAAEFGTHMRDLLGVAGTRGSRGAGHS